MARGATITAGRAAAGARALLALRTGGRLALRARGRLGAAVAGMGLDQLPNARATYVREQVAAVLDAITTQGEVR